MVILLTTTNLTYSLVSENIRRDEAVRGGRGWGPPRGPPPPQLLREVAAESLPVDNFKKREEEKEGKKKEWRRITGEDTKGKRMV